MRIKRCIVTALERLCDFCDTKFWLHWTFGCGSDVKILRFAELSAKLDEKWSAGAWVESKEYNDE